jgi:hypothetical protein
MGLSGDILPAQSCGLHGVAAQVLGSGGPELQDKRASSSYIVREDGQASALVDCNAQFVLLGRALGV